MRNSCGNRVFINTNLGASGIVYKTKIKEELK